LLVLFLGGRVNVKLITDFHVGPVWRFTLPIMAHGHLWLSIM